MRLLIMVTLISVNTAFAKQQFSASRLDKLSGERKASFDTKSEWDMKYARPSFIFGKAPVKFLAENYDFIPEASTVLDMGMGEGRNAVFLASKGHKVTGVDISSVAIKKSQHLAREFGVKIKGVVASLEKYTIAPHSYDVILCLYYVDRKLTDKIIKWLKPGGILIYESHTIDERSKKGHKKTKVEYYLKKQELLTMFKGMQVLKYEEPLHEKVSRASIILRKPKA
jgi:tellurite methyltransferase